MNIPPGVQVGKTWDHVYHLQPFGIHAANLVYEFSVQLIGLVVSNMYLNE
jgi:hypothetical protein